MNDQTVYYFNGGAYELVVGYRYNKQAKEWRIETGSIRGSFALDAATQAVEQLVGFMTSQGIKALYAMTAKRDPSDLTEVIYRAIRDAAQRHPSIGSVTEEDWGRKTRWGFLLK